MLYNFTKGYKPQVQKCIMGNEVFFHLEPQKAQGGIWWNIFHLGEFHIWWNYEEDTVMENIYLNIFPSKF